MDSIAPVGSSTYFPLTVPMVTPTIPAPASMVVAAPTDLVTFSGIATSGPNQAGTYPAPDPAFAAFLRSDPALANDFASSSANPIGFSVGVLAQDDTLAAANSNSPSAPLPGQTSTPVAGASTALSSAQAAVLAQSIDLGAMASTSALSSPLVDALFGTSAPAPDPTAVFFTGQTMASLLNAQGAAALAYLSPQATAAPGSLLSASA